MQKRVVWVGITSIAVVALMAAAWLITNKPSLHGAVIESATAGS